MTSFYRNWKLFLCLTLVCIGYSQQTSEEINLTTKLVRIGEDVRLSCLVDDSYVYRKQMKITWERPPGTVIMRGPELYLRNVQRRDIGSYHCKAVGMINGRVVSKSVIEEVTVDLPPVSESGTPDIEIPRSTNGKIVIFETQNLNIDCKVRNWSKKDYVVQWLSPQGYVVSDKENLFIESVLHKKHSGEYVCRILHNQNQREVFKKEIMVVIEVPQLKVEILPTESLSIGGLIHRRCIGFRFEGSTETFTYTWMDPLGVRMSQTDTLQLPINAISAQGKYTCQYQGLRSGKRFEVVSVVVISKEATSNRPIYRIVISEMPQPYRVGERLILRCAITPSISDLTYTWYKDEKFLQVGSTVDIAKFSKKDFGTYKCRATGRAESGIDIDLFAYSYKRSQTFVPHRHEMIEGQGTQIEVPLHRTKELNCFISLEDGFSGQNVVWTFNGKELRTEEDFRRWRLAREDRSISSILHIASTEIDNEGRYTCSVGGVTKATTITVVEESGLLTIYPSIQEDFQGRRSEFHCKINNIPNVNKNDITWHFVSKDGSRTVQLPNGRWRKAVSTVIEHTGYILTDTLELSDNGYMVCRLPLGLEDRAEIIVKTKIKPFIVKISEKNISVRRYQRFEFECFSLDSNDAPIGTPILKFLNGSLVSSDPRFKVSSSGASRIRLVAPNGIAIDSSQLQMSCSVEEKVAIVTINIEEECPPQWRRCASGECLEARKFCDVIIHCADGSDEDPRHCDVCDPVRRPCAAMSGGNGTVDYFDVHTACDGENNCVNGFDERNCPVQQKCNTRQFKCKDGSEVPYGYVCDKQSDCGENEDEIGCRLPMIIEMSPKKMVVRQGSDVKLFCEAVGFPLPKIIWRYNWRCLPDEGRMIVADESRSCNVAVSTLTIRDAQPGDDVQYTCEALSGSDRHLSEPITLYIAR